MTSNPNISDYGYVVLVKKKKNIMRGHTEFSPHCRLLVDCVACCIVTLSSDTHLSKPTFPHTHTEVSGPVKSVDSPFKEPRGSKTGTSQGPSAENTAAILQMHERLTRTNECNLICRL